MDNCLVQFAKGCLDFNFLPINGFAIKPLKVKLLAGEQKATENLFCSGKRFGGALVTCGVHRFFLPPVDLFVAWVGTLLTYPAGVDPQKPHPNRFLEFGCVGLKGSRRKTIPLCGSPHFGTHPYFSRPWKWYWEIMMLDFWRPIHSVEIRRCRARFRFDQLATFDGADQGDE